MTLLISLQILTWLAIAFLGLLCFATARQVGILHERVAPAGALSMNQKIKIGEAAPALTARTLAGTLLPLGGEREGRSQLLFFLSPDCPVCKSLLPALKGAAKNEKHRVEVVLVSEGDEPLHLAYVREQELQDIPYIVSELVGRSYGVGKLPYAVLIDERGQIASMELVNSREHLDSLFVPKEHLVSGIQEFLARRAS